MYEVQIESKILYNNINKQQIRCTKKAKVEANEDLYLGVYISK